MARLLIAAIVLAAAITLYGLFDCLLRDRGLVRVLPKPVWAIIILLVPILGFVLWFFLGRGSDGAPSATPRRSGPSAPDDDEDYLRQVARDVELNKHHPGPAAPPADTQKTDDDSANGPSHGDDVADSDRADEGTPDVPGASGGDPRRGDGRGHTN